MPRVDLAYTARRRTEIMEAAQRCFARLGFHKTTLQDVFRESGLSAGAVYNYFKSKEALIAAIAEERHAAEQTFLDPPKGESAIAQLRRAARAFFVELDTPEGQRQRRVGVFSWSEALLNDEVRASVLEGLNGPRTQLAQLIRQGQLEKTLRADLDADATARAMIALFHGFILQKLWDPTVSVERYLEALEPLFSALLDGARVVAAAP
jgi:TetR/AcrR family transcriptional repressor of uid operon